MNYYVSVTLSQTDVLVVLSNILSTIFLNTLPKYKLSIANKVPVRSDGRVEDEEAERLNVNMRA